MITKVFSASCLVRFILLFIALQLSVLAQSPAPTPQTSPSPSSLEKRFFKNLVHDQTAIWTAPFHLRGKDAKWFVPLGLATAGLVITDRDTARWLGVNRTRENVSRGISYLGSGYSVGAIAGAFYLFGRIEKNARARETGLLSGEALIDSGIVVTVLKNVTERPRPFSDDGSGQFFHGGNSFPSGHSAAAWSLATVVANEYQDQPIVKYGAYGLVAAVSISRFTGRKHFLSDVLIGSAIGYGVGRYVYRTHHDPGLDTPGRQPLKTAKQSKLFPFIIPHYDRSARAYGATLKWSF